MAFPSWHCLLVPSACLVALVAPVRNAQAADGPVPVIRIGRRVWTEKELLGVSRNELRARFDQEEKEYTVEWLRRVLRLNGALLFSPELANEKDRRKLADALFKVLHTNALRSAAANLLGAQLLDRVVSQHGIDPGDWLDDKVLRDGFRRQVAALDFICAHREAPHERNKQLHEEMVKRFRYEKPFELWDKHRRIDPRRARFQWSHLCTWGKATGQEDARIKRAMAFYLLQRACSEGGPFFDGARRRRAKRDTVYTVVDLVNYKGDREQLGRMFRLLVGRDGDVAREGIAFARQWLSGLDVDVGFSVSRHAPRGPARDAREPLVGELLRTGPAQYTIAGYARRGAVPAAPPPSGEWVFRCEAFILARERFLPDVQLLVDDVGQGVGLLQLSYDLGSVGKSALSPDVKLGEFIRRPYPAEEFEDHDGEIHTAAVRGATLVLANDKAGAQKLVADLLVQCGKLKPRAPRRALLRVARLVCLQLKLQAELKHVEAAAKAVGP